MVESTESNRMAMETWHCPVIFYTGTRYESERYEKMVRVLLKLKEKWGIGVLNLWDDKELNSISEEQYHLYHILKTKKMSFQGEGIFFSDSMLFSVLIFLCCQVLTDKTEQFSFLRYPL